MFKKILVPIDVDHFETAAAVYHKTAELARFSGAKIRIVSVMPGFGMPIVAAYISEEMRKDAVERFEASVAAFVKEHCDEAVSYRVRTGKNWEEIIKAADNWGADLIVVYHNHRRKINEVFSGSCSERVQENAACSVLRIRKVLG